MASEARNPFSVASNFSRLAFAAQRSEIIIFPLEGPESPQGVGGALASPASQSPGPKVNEQAQLEETTIF